MVLNLHNTIFLREIKQTIRFERKRLFNKLQHINLLSTVLIDVKEKIIGTHIITYLTGLEFTICRWDEITWDDRY